MSQLFPELDDGRTFEEEMRDLGVEVIKNVPVVVDVEWMSKRLSSSSGSYDINVTKTGITVSVRALKMIGSEYVLLGVGKTQDDGKPALLIKPSTENDNNAYKITKANRRLSRAAATRLIAKGLPIGQYTLLKGKTAFAAVPVKGAVR